MRPPHIISTTHPVGDEGRPLVAGEQPKARERIELPPLHLEPFDPWANSINPEVLTQAGRDAMPEAELAPWGWFKLPEATRAYLGGLAIALLHEHPAPANEGSPGVPNRLQRLTKVYEAFDTSLRGAYVPRAAFERNQQTPLVVAWAARAYIEAPAERVLAHQHHQDLLALGLLQHIALVKELLRKLDGRGGVMARVRAQWEQLGSVLARWEKRLGGNT